MNINQQWIDLENRSARWMDAWFRRHVGREVDPSEIEAHAQAVSSLADTMALSYRADPDAWSLLNGIVVEAQLTPIELEIERLTEQHYTFDDILFDGQPVTPYSRNQYLCRENDPHRRSEILARVAQGHPAVDQALAQHHAKRTEVAAKWKYAPLDDFLLAEGINLAQLRNLLIGLATAMRPAFERHFADNRAAVFGDQHGEPWEDFVTLYMNRWSAYADQFIFVIDNVTPMQRLVRTLGFAADAITMDIEDCPRKRPGASAWNIRTPGDVRICFKPAGGAHNLAMFYHEMGHALHFTSIDARLPYPIRTGFSPGIAETFSFWLQSLLSDPIFLSELGLSEPASAAIIRFEQLVRATFATWLPAQALCIVDYWVEGPFTLEELGDHLSHYVKQFMGLSMPASAIRVTAQLARLLNFNTIGYPIAYARLGHLLNQLEAIQHDWWHAPTGVDVVRSYMRGGRNAGFPSSMLDIGPFVQRYTLA